MWYVATLVLRCRVGDHQTEPWTVEEQIRLIDAVDEEMAYNKALTFGKRAEHTYKNEAGETVSWEFVGLEDLEWIVEEPIGDGVQVRARFLETSDPSSLVTNKDSLVLFKSKPPALESN